MGNFRRRFLFRVKTILKLPTRKSQPAFSQALPRNGLPLWPPTTAIILIPKTPKPKTLFWPSAPKINDPKRLSMLDSLIFTLNPRRKWRRLLRITPSDYQHRRCGRKCQLEIPLAKNLSLFPLLSRENCPQYLKDLVWGASAQALSENYLRD